MNTKTGIEWTSVTWNPIRGCSKVSAGCANCYAEKQAARFSGKGQPYEGLIDNKRWNGTVRVVQEHLDDPLRWTKPRRVFVNSMSDLFHESLSFEDIATVFGVMGKAFWHEFQVLTKRAERMAEWFRWTAPGQPGYPIVLKAAQAHAWPAHAMRAVNADLHTWRWPLTNVHLGVSVENQDTADQRIPLLLDTPAAVRWISAEPLLGDTSLFAFLKAPLRDEALAALRSPPLPGLDWVVVGGESGPKARPCDVGWIREIVEQCRTAEVPVFVKQLGSNPVALTRNAGMAPGVSSIEWNVRWQLKHHKGGDPSEWPEDLRVREFPS